MNSIDMINKLTEYLTCRSNADSVLKHMQQTAQ